MSPKPAQSHYPFHSRSSAGDTGDCPSHYAEIIEDYPDLIEEDIQACLAFAADKERHSVIAFSHDQAPV